MSDDKVRVQFILQFIVLYDLFTNELFYIFCQRKTVKKDFVINTSIMVLSVAKAIRKFIDNRYTGRLKQQINFR